MLRPASACLLAALLGGCATDAAWVAGDGATNPRFNQATCGRLFAALDQAVDQAGVRDAQYTRIPGYPYLRTDRYLASFRHHNFNSGEWAGWLNALRERDREARRYELANLPRAHWPGSLPRSNDKLTAELDRCGADALRALAARPQSAGAWQKQIAVPPDYDHWRRALGLYPVTGHLALRGAKKLYRELARDFRVPLAGIPIRGRRVVYAPSGPQTPMRADEVRRWLARHRGFGMPAEDEPDTRRLINSFAPVWIADETGGHDRIGAPVWRSPDAPGIDISQVFVFYHFSKTRGLRRSLWQINYSVWFGARPAQRAMDLYAGRLDGLIWRVTLGEDGKPLLYDSIHHCGCYHSFLPTAALRPGPRRAGFAEPLFAPQTLRDLLPGERAHLYLATGTHYLQQVRIAAPSPSPAIRAYRLAAYNSLRSLPVPGGRRSLFGPAGLVTGTERMERWLLWPLGIANAGAMRQWGRHATAFIGQRHFDDPYLIDRYFRPAPPGMR